MAINVGDLWPHASGTSNLGVDTAAGTINGFSSEIRPFAHVHQNSGIFHGAYGSSGVVRFGPLSALHALIGDAGRPDRDAFQFSVNGGTDYLLSIGSGSTNDLSSNGLDGRVFMEVPGNQQLQLIASGLQINCNGNYELFAGAGLTYTVGGNLTTVADGGRVDIYGGLFRLDADGLILMTSKFGPLTLQSDTDSTSLLGKNISITANGLDAFDDIIITSNSNDVNTIAWGGSGILSYKFGPYEGWHTTVGAGNVTPVPIAHSGQVLQMILENGGGGGASTLQEAYDNGQTIFIDGAQDMQISAGNHKLRLSTDGDKAEINMSGLLTYPSIDMEIGDINMLLHSQDVSHGNITVPTTQAESQALSLGIGTPFINTGSGIASLAVCSGVSSFFNVGTQTLSTTATNVNFNTNQVPDGHFIIDSNFDIILLVPGLYKATYAASCEKTAGTTRQQADAQLELNNKLIFGSLSHTYLRNNTNENKGTANGICLFDADAGDILTMPITLTSSPVSNTVRTENRAANIVLEYMGPQRGLVTVTP